MTYTRRGEAGMPNAEYSVPGPERIRNLISKLADAGPVASSLGTPFLADTEATSALVAIGSPSVPYLLEALTSENHHIVMYAAYCLGLIGDKRALRPLQEFRDQNIEGATAQNQTAALVATVNAAIRRLESAPQK